MKAGDAVRVYVHGDEATAAVGHIVLLKDQYIAVGFATLPPFVMRKRAGGVMLIAYRETLNGKLWGPWIELLGSGHYEIEEASEELRP